MGVGRFVFTPVLPLMETGAGLTSDGASYVATANYVGYLVGALVGIAAPPLARRRLSLRVAGALLLITLAAMPLAHDAAAWVILRGSAGAASAIVFMVAGNVIVSEFATRSTQLVGWAYGGVGAGIALSGMLMAVVSSIGDWKTAWWAAALLTAVLLAGGWNVGQAGGATATMPAKTAGASAPQRQKGPWFVLLSASYFLEGAGYIVTGTFLIAALSATSPGWLSGSAWTIVGLAAIPSCAVWASLATRVSRPTLITAALFIQAVGIALPAISSHPAAGVISAVLFGATFMAITTLSLATGVHLGITRAIPLLTAGYGIGQILGPLLVAPLLADGYQLALLAGGVLVFLAAVGALLLRIRFPHHDQASLWARRTA
ncbi:MULTISPECIES: YbfB/YjiJ family MFS transporter [unclassified Microbacterium]|uniref:YbfB/YjiJ family MFS transporter n=1 Tax=Microbacterium TaxID=33882 RepID=UPI003B9E1AD2